jgi:hypothetical protein
MFLRCPEQKHPCICFTTVFCKKELVHGGLNSFSKSCHMNRSCRRLTLPFGRFQPEIHFDEEVLFEFSILMVVEGASVASRAHI